MRIASVIALVVMAASAPSLADQCFAVAPKAAKAAAGLLHKGTRYVPYCKSCNMKHPKAADIRSVGRADVRDFDKKSKLKTVWVGSTREEGSSGADLAYLYVEQKAKSGKFYNLAKLAGCPVTGEPNELTVK